MPCSLLREGGEPGPTRHIRAQQSARYTRQWCGLCCRRRSRRPLNSQHACQTQSESDGTGPNSVDTLTCPKFRYPWRCEDHAERMGSRTLARIRRSATIATPFSRLNFAGPGKPTMPASLMSSATRSSLTRMSISRVSSACTRWDPQVCCEAVWTSRIRPVSRWRRIRVGGTGRFPYM